MINIKTNFEADFKLRDFLNQPLKIGNRVIKKRLVLAPLSKLGNVAFRELIAQYSGFGLLFSEMSGARSIATGNRHVDAGFMWRPEELLYLVCQLYGDDPETMAQAARRVEDQGFFGVDINLGCSVARICKSNCGAALLKQPVLAAKIVSAIRKAVSVPVFVKFRTGWEDNPQNAADMAKRFEDAGADALTFHPRVAPDRRTRPPKWEYIGKVKDAVSIPVFGNGNVFDKADCEKMLKTTGCDGIAIGRLAVARPWIFAQLSDDFEPDAEIFQYAAIQLIHLLLKHFEPTTALRRFYKFSSYYASNFLFGHTFYSLVHKAKNIDALQENVARFFETQPDLLIRPNITMLR